MKISTHTKNILASKSRMISKLFDEAKEMGDFMPISVLNASVKI